MLRSRATFFGRLLLGWVISFLVFGLLALAFSGQLVMGGTLSLEEFWRMTARDWLPWAALAPVLFLLVAHWPLERPRLAWRIPFHLFVALLVLGLCALWGETVAPDIHREPPRETQPGPPPARPPIRNAPGAPGGTGGPVPGAPRPGPKREKQPMPLAARIFLGGFRLPIYLALISIAHALCFYRRARERELRAVALEADLAQARLAALRMQLQPHFLFNSLNAIAELVHKNPEAADAMLVALSNFLRLTLDTAGEQEVPLKRELEFAERYLEIEQVRFGERLQLVCEADPATLAAQVPSFLLQPLLENAVRHGLGSRPGELRITLRAARHGRRLRLRIADNGTGRPGDHPVREGIGLANTRRRLEEIYGGDASLKIDTGAGFAVEIEIPFSDPS